MEEIDRLCPSAIADWRIERVDLTDLTPYAVQSRYDLGFWTDHVTVVEALEIVEQVRRAVLAALPDATRLRRGEPTPIAALHDERYNKVTQEGAARGVSIAAVFREAIDYLPIAALGFALVLDPDGGPMWLRLTGPEGIKPFLRATFVAMGELSRGSEGITVR